MSALLDKGTDLSELKDFVYKERAGEGTFVYVIKTKCVGKTEKNNSPRLNTSNYRIQKYSTDLASKAVGQLYGIAKGATSVSVNIWRYIWGKAWRKLIGRNIGIGVLMYSHDAHQGIWLRIPALVNTIDIWRDFILIASPSVSANHQISDKATFPGLISLKAMPTKRLPLSTSREPNAFETMMRQAHTRPWPSITDLNLQNQEPIYNNRDLREKLVLYMLRLISDKNEIEEALEGDLSALIEGLGKEGRVKDFVKEGLEKLRVEMRRRKNMMEENGRLKEIVGRMEEEKARMEEEIRRLKQ
ncbi:hypothetical protein K469DRAFT_694300 [Zopfia rhizophila CBS 207.26]|uniref:Uncharacterized protein n=1 Tax=Zopfia rhizophila CBS 207.26 TaxID=1314779 RepID=A0A6A6EJ56_9PEZI|nr:hypothetical protein K469DRAFT_694300 [Zopfia rhizophila CBS 207.26]